MAVKVKSFDGVEMKHRGAERVRRETRGMTLEEELTYWSRGTDELLKRQAALCQKPTSGKISKTSLKTSQDAR